MKPITIGNRKVGYGNPCFIIAEAGINHGGDIETAKKMIEVAAKSGADAIKFQTYITEKRVDTKTPLFNILKKCELKEDDWKELFKIAKKNNITFFSTPFDKESVDLLMELPVELFKIASFYLVNLSLLDHIASKGIPIIASRGMANKKEISNAIEIFEKYKVEYAILHCVSAYPTKDEDANLDVIKSLKNEFNCTVGYSDHTIGIDIPLYSVAVGAHILEKHFTLDKNSEGPDHKLSVDPTELKELVSKIRRLEKILGSDEIKLLEAEKGTMQYRKYN